MMLRYGLYFRDLSAGKLLLHLALNHGSHAALKVVVFVF